ncbi:bifunctional ADP-dependent (S)-NAD(P)H-hydrate dehydratase/NAD(P)H-hydrate epimerase [Crenothrix sp. D3]|nr:bifunctional ADP-dependent (S)-NAD(P)H-hydrate dehydratase/NAD(P)H-hydrate epimerase [Crenothrix sp. D3]
MQTLPINLYRNAQIRELEQLAIREHGIESFELMSRAGYAVFQEIIRYYPNAQTFEVFCGSGNNAGDGYIVATLLLRAGLSVCVVSVGDPKKLKGDAQTAYWHYVAAQGMITPFQADLDLNSDVIIDALLGSGLNKPVTGHYAAAIDAINQSPAFVLAVDMPSGLDSNTGNVMGVAVKADVTVTFIALHQGLFTGQAADYCGIICYATLAIPEPILATQRVSSVRVINQLLPRRLRCTHKGDYGHVLIIGGEQGYSGAARLAGEAALRVGAGLVSIATRSSHASLMNLNRPELMCHGVDTAEQLMPLLAKASVIAIGTGLGQSDWAIELLAAVLTQKKPLIIDADALNLLARKPVANPNWILTPHPAEAARLLNCSTANIQQDRFAAVSALQEKYQGTVVLKGAGSLIASSDTLAVSHTGNAGMASGGMGDVLTGVIAGLIAQGLTLQEAAQQGVYQHGKAADCAAQANGERGLLASDLMHYLRLGVNE